MNFLELINQRAIVLQFGHLLLPPFSSQVLSDSFSTPWTVACQASQSMGSPRQEYWSGLPFPSLWDLPDPGIKPVSSSLAGGFFFFFFFTTDPLGKSSLDIQFSSVTQSCLDSLQPYGLQHTSHPCPSLTPRVYANSCPLSW